MSWQVCRGGGVVPILKLARKNCIVERWLKMLVIFWRKTKVQKSIS